MKEPKQKKPSKLDMLADETREETIRRTTLAAKGLSAHKAEHPLLSSQFAHPEYNEGAEHLAGVVAADQTLYRLNLQRRRTK